MKRKEENMVVVPYQYEDLQMDATPRKEIDG
jgi:hypothetical protein